jgi:hypothetical protein
VVRDYPARVRDRDSGADAAMSRGGLIGLMFLVTVSWVLLLMLFALFR